MIVNLVPDLGHITLGQHLAVIDENDGAGHGLDFGQDVTRDQHRFPPPAELLHQLDDLLARYRIHAVQRLVHEDDFRIVRQRLGQLDLLAHTLGIATEPTIGGVGQVEHLQRLPGPLIHLGGLVTHQP
ncbi:MAG: hypothetical protein ABIF77_11480 [bacterium]